MSPSSGETATNGETNYMLTLIYSSIGEQTEYEAPLTAQELQEERETHNRKVMRDYKMKPKAKEPKFQRSQISDLRIAPEPPKYANIDFSVLCDEIDDELTFNQFKKVMHINHRAVRLEHVIKFKITKSKKLLAKIDHALMVWDEVVNNEINL